MRIFFYLFLVLLLSGCIDEYAPKGTKGLDELLVVEGTITNGESIIQISKSINISEKMKENKVDHASVYIEKDTGERLESIFQGEGTYLIETGDLEKDVKYRLHIALDGKEYRSEYLSPLFTPEIDSLVFEKNARKVPVVIYINTHDPEDRSRYYMWSYDEVWEVKSELRANYGYMDGKLMFFEITEPSPKNTHYCWVRNRSNTLLLGSAEKLSENIIFQNKLTEIACDNSKLLILYNIRVAQKQIRKEAYHYYYYMQKNVEQTGGLFSTIPSELKGNLSCVSDPDIPVIGYIDVTTTTYKDLYIPEGYYDGLSPDLGCKDEMMYGTGFYPEYAYFYVNPVLFDPLTDTIFAPHECVDCRLMPGATKDRPDFWPNDHY